MLLKEEVQDKKKEIAQKAFENGMWSEGACFYFMGTHHTPSQVEAWEKIINKVLSKPYQKRKHRGKIKVR